ncbi:MAG: acetyl-CoA hydrolase/transferase family protein, partial [Firmicutes bacterium]|nr:acetyl-CoA hydrolase/transferase family protein [Bacillota bacterium]
MKDWKELYASKLCTPDEAVKYVKDHDRIVVGGGPARPKRLMQALIDNASMFKDVKIMHGLSHGVEDYCNEEYKDNFTHESLFLSSGTRKHHSEGRVQLYPCYYYQLSDWFGSGYIPTNVLMIQVSKPDENGYCSCGLIADFIQEGVDSADIVIAQINGQMPWSDSEDCIVHISRFDHIIECDEPMPITPRSVLTDVELKIGENCATLVNDGDTIQVGIGSLPDAVCVALKNKKDLGVHTELLTDGLMDLYKCGAINNSKKSMDQGAMVTTFVMGTQELYDFVDHNPAVVLKRVKDVNHPVVIANCANMISINTCIEVDLMGQVVASSAGTRQISGSGGQVDFVRGTMMSLDGKGRSVIAITSVHEKKGQRNSRIKPLITEGSSVTVSREDVDYVVTEYGIARLSGRSLQD